MFKLLLFCGMLALVSAKPGYLSAPLVYSPTVVKSAPLVTYAAPAAYAYSAPIVKSAPYVAAPVAYTSPAHFAYAAPYYKYAPSYFY